MLMSIDHEKIHHKSVMDKRFVADDFLYVVLHSNLYDQ